MKAVRPPKKPAQTCGDCIHEYACAMWNVGSLHNADATHCTNYETVKQSAAYFCGRLDRERKLLDRGEK